MPSYTERWTEVHEPLATLAPITANGTVGAHDTGWVDMENYYRMIILLNIGTPAQGATIDIDVEEATDNAGTGIQNIAGKSITQVVAADTEGIIAIELRAEELTMGYSFVNVEVTVAVDTYTYGLWVIGMIPHYAPVPVTAWQEIVV